MDGIESGRLLAWYGGNRREMPWRNTKDPYRVWLSEVMLQQTQVATVIPYYERFLARFPTPGDLAAADDQEVLKLWEGLGYYSRCHNFLKAVRQVCRDHGGAVPGDPALFSALAGVGPYTTAAVMSIAFDRPLPVVDGNVIRVVSRVYGIGDDVTKAPVKKRIGGIMAGVIPRGMPGDFNQAVMELGALVCTPVSPSCDLCPLSESCFAFREGRTGDLPFKPARPKVPVYDVVLAWLEEEGRVLIQKRPDKGHLAGMWEFPGGKVNKGETPEAALAARCLEELGTTVRVREKIAAATHAYTHFKIRLALYRCERTGPQPASLKGQPVLAVTPGELKNYPLPKANHKLLAKLRGQDSAFG